MIRAEVHTNDLLYAVRFDAAPFFEVAYDDEIVLIASSGSALPAICGQIAFHVASLPGYEALTDAFRYVKHRPEKSLNCTIFLPDVLNWVRCNRPALIHNLGAILLPDVVSSPEWDGDCIWEGDYAHVPLTRS